jgi:hypothetical protein
VDILLRMPVSVPGLTSAFALTALLLASVAPIPGWDNHTDRAERQVPLPLVFGGLLLLAASSTIFYVDNPLLIARCFG